MIGLPVLASWRPDVNVPEPPPQLAYLAGEVETVDGVRYAPVRFPVELKEVGGTFVGARIHGVVDSRDWTVPVLVWAQAACREEWLVWARLACSDIGQGGPLPDAEILRRAKVARDISVRKWAFEVLASGVRLGTGHSALRLLDVLRGAERLPTVRRVPTV